MCVLVAGMCHLMNKLLVLFALELRGCYFVCGT